MALLEIAKELQIQPKVVLLAVAKITKIVNNNKFRYNNTFNNAGVAIRRAKCIYLIQFQGCIFCLKNVFCSAGVFSAGAENLPLVCSALLGSVRQAAAWAESS